MKKIKAISFDVWNTLINSNKNYIHARNSVIASHLNISIEEANANYQNCKKFLDKIAEINGTCFSTLDCWKIICQMSGKNNIDPKKLMNECQILFSDFIPTYNEELVLELKKINDRGIITGITSNTNFIAGKTLYNNIFEEWNVFKTLSFSDEVLYAKPHDNIFKATYHKFNDITPLKPENILHIGDNKICDGGSIHSGFEFKHVENPNELLSLLKTNSLFN